ncbi:hypothetical protein DFP72DRAFT_1068232 [Ephemerocybe angulata]|uniref:Uncharacterized protein n=1 Tax=Ephemerocybe angulata TaxID=980116 RepID=A0A8H6HYG6_9AGAR|nr:hypothetical protein DFP72DRAFT_1068232 [Tulosesus angulatus]
MPTVINADDNDTHLAYAPGWEVLSSPREYNGGTHCTSTNGASVTLNFRGKYVLVSATIPASNTTTDYSRIDFDIDGGVQAGTLSQRAYETPIYNDPIYESSGLPETDHTLTLTFVDRPNTIKFCLDKIEISADPGEQAELLSPPTLGTRESEFEAREFHDMASPVMTLEAKQPTLATIHPARRIETAALAGGAVCGFAAGALVMLFVCMIIKRKRQNTGELKI